MIDYLSNKWKIHFEEEELESLYNAIGNIGRPNISRLLLKHGYVKTNQEGFDKYLIEAYDSIRDLKLELPPEEAIELIVEANGIPVLAHPYSLKKDLVELRQYIKELMNYGLQGIEVYHSNHSPEFMNELSKISDEYGMLVSGGSDYHGFLIKPSVKLGIGKDNLSIKHLSLLDKIKAKR